MDDDKVNRDYIKSVQDKSDTLILPVFSVTVTPVSYGKKKLLALFDITYNVPKYFYFGLILIIGGLILGYKGLTIGGVIVFGSGIFFTKGFVKAGLKLGYKKKTKRKLEVL